MSSDNLAPGVIARIIREVKKLIDNPQDDIKIHPSDDDVTEVHATITGPASTPYEGGVFRMKLVLGSDFPAAPPKGFFLTKIFHPNVAKNGEICVNTLKKDWKSELGISHILLTIKCLLIYPNPESALNEEAGRMLLERYDDFAIHARLMTGIHAKPKGGDTTTDENVSNVPASTTSSIKKKTTTNTDKKKKAGLRRL